MVNAASLWLTCIGNIPVRAGDYVWTDGRCVYGNVIEGGEPFLPIIPPDEGLPLAIDSKDYFYYSKGKEEKKFSQNNSYDFYMLNDKNSWNFIKVNWNPIPSGIPSDLALIEAEYSKERTKYNPKICLISSCDYYSGRQPYEIEGNDKVFKNDEIIDSYMDKLKSFLVGLPGKSITTITANPILIDADGNYCLRVDISESTAIYDEKYVLTPKERISVSKIIIYKSNADSVVIDYHYIHHSNFGRESEGNHTTNNVTIPMPNGWYCEFQWDENYANANYDWYGNNTSIWGLQYTAEKNKFSIFNEKNELQMEFINSWTPGKLKFASLTAQKKLLIYNKSLFLYENNDFKKISSFCRNMRLQEIKDIKKWCKQVKSFDPFNAQNKVITVDF